MKQSALIFMVVLLIWGCSNDNPLDTEAPDLVPPLNSSNQVLLDEQQLEGEVRFTDGKIAPFGTMVRAYRNGVLVPGAEDETDSGTGHYGFSGSDANWPTGWYYIITDTVYSDSNPYVGARWSYHVYPDPTYDQDITLLLYESSPGW